MASNGSDGAGVDIHNEDDGSGDDHGDDLIRIIVFQVAAANSVQSRLPCKRTEQMLCIAEKELHDKLLGQAGRHQQVREHALEHADAERVADHRRQLVHAHRRWALNTSIWNPLKPKELALGE